mmetsp:Transcript_18020/g.30620  ORF Transcript_18020/g.30620 Transcript_18020/m.30620 type:complete len:151 (-) Transcript_18020:121-573(-)
MVRPLLYTVSFTEEEEREILKHANILICMSGDKKRKRQRTSPEQLSILENMFKGNRTPDFETRAALSKQLGMTPRRIQIWFQNKRAKMKKLKLEGRSDFNFIGDNCADSSQSPSDGSPSSSENSPTPTGKAGYPVFDTSDVNLQVNTPNW